MKQKPEQLFKMTVRLPVKAINYVHDAKRRTGMSKERIVLEALKHYAGDAASF